MSTLTPPVPTLTARELQARRAALGLTQAQLAHALSITVPTLSRWETGARPVGSPGMVRLALEALETRRPTE